MLLLWIIIYNSAPHPAAILNEIYISQHQIENNKKKKKTYADAGKVLIESKRGGINVKDAISMYMLLIFLIITEGPKI